MTNTMGCIRMVSENDLVKKALVSLALETTLLEIGKETYDKVVHDLYKKHNCYLPDCYDHPEYLNEILKDLYGNAHNIVVEKINKQLEEFSYHKSISHFIKVLNQ